MFLVQRQVYQPNVETNDQPAQTDFIDNQEDLVSKLKKNVELCKLMQE